MAVIEARALTRRFGDLVAVDHLDLCVEAGEVFGLLGPNGSGKTTLIRMLVGLLRPTEGQAVVLGHPMPDKGVLAQIGYMTQAGAFFGAMCGGVTEERVQELIELVNLEERSNSLVSTLSGGMRQRASLAVALVHRPKLLLLDEPSVGVDPTLRVAFWEHFRGLAKQGCALVISSHVMDEAERCDRLAFLRNGRLIALGTPSELRAKAGRDRLEDAFLVYATGSSHER
jgi:ABC-2 type transport system ATP-binding protein